MRRQKVYFNGDIRFRKAERDKLPHEYIEIHERKDGFYIPLATPVKCCVFCENEEQLYTYRQKHMCKPCLLGMHEDIYNEHQSEFEKLLKE